MCSYYTQKDFENIINKGLNYSIPPEILQLIQEIETKTKQKVAQQAKQFEARHNYVGKPQQQRQTNTHSSTGDWKTPINKNTTNTTINTTLNHNQNIPAFQIRKIVVKEGRDKNVQKIKVALNKISKLNYSHLQPEILQTLHELYEVDIGCDVVMDEANINGIELFKTTAKDLFQLISRNTDVNMSNIYATLYATFCMDDVPFSALFKAELLEEFIAQWKMDILDVKNVAAMEETSDEFCGWTRTMNERRGKTVFWVQLTKNEVMQTSVCIQLIDYLLQEIREVVDNKTDISALNKSLVEELIENVFLIISSGGRFLFSFYPEEWTKMTEQFQYLSAVTIKENPNMSNRAKFKCKDILDKRNG